MLVLTQQKLQSVPQRVLGLGWLFIYLFIFKSFFYLYFFLNLYCIFWTHGHGQQCGDCGGCEVGGQVGGSGRMYKAGKWDGLFEF